MWVIVEGGDGSGKSTLAKEIMRQLSGDRRDVVYTHMGPPERPDTAVSECLGGFYGQYDGSFDLVSDRWAWGELVYGPIYRPDDNIDGYGAFGERGWGTTQSFGAAKGAFVVLLVPPVEVTRARCEKRGEDFIDLDHLGKIRQSYFDVWEKAELTRGQLISSAFSLDMVPSIAGTVINHARRRAADVALRNSDFAVGTAAE